MDLRPPVAKPAAPAVVARQQPTPRQRSGHRNSSTGTHSSAPTAMGGGRTDAAIPGINRASLLRSHGTRSRWNVATVLHPRTTPPITFLTTRVHSRGRPGRCRSKRRFGRYPILLGGAVLIGILGMPIFGDCAGHTGTTTAANFILTRGARDLDPSTRRSRKEPLGATLVMTGPTASTIPAPSWPSTAGSWAAMSPCMTW